MELPVTVTYLEMTGEEEVVPFESERRLEVRRTRHACPELSRFFYVAVGSDWGWHERLEWDRDRWLSWIDRPELETWIGYLDGTPVGYYELEVQPDRHVQLSYFGLLPSFIGHGLGAELLAWAVERAWELGPRRVWLHTCTMDHPRALTNYLRRGFRAYEVEERVERLPDGRAPLWPRNESSPRSGER